MCLLAAQEGFHRAHKLLLGARERSLHHFRFSAAFSAELPVQGFAEGTGILKFAAKDIAVASFVISGKNAGNAAAAGG